MSEALQCDCGRPGKRGYDSYVVCDRCRKLEQAQNRDRVGGSLRSKITKRCHDIESPGLRRGDLLKMKLALDAYLLRQEVSDV